MLKKLNRHLTLTLLLLLTSHHTLAAGSTPTILILGDSISAGYGVNLRSSWATLLQNRLRNTGYPHHLINASISGDTTQGGLARLPQLLKQHQPQIVILELGGNDGLRGQPITNIRNNLDAMLQLCHQNNSLTLLLGMQLPANLGRNYTEKFKNLYSALAKQHRVALVPFLLAHIAEHPERMQNDQIHPNESAQPLLLENIWPTLKPLLGHPK